MAIWEEIKDGSTTFRRPRAKATGDSDRTASELRDVAIRGLLGKLPGNWPIIADIGMHIMGPSTDAALAKGKDYLGNVMRGYWDKTAEGTRKATYEALTDRAPATDIAAFKERNMRPAGGWRSESRQDPMAGRFDSIVPAKPGTYPKWAEPLVEHPDTASKIVGTTVAAGLPLAAGAFLTSFAQGQKPRSDYAYPVEPTRGSYDETGGVSASSNTYNPSVESARASAQFKHELEEQKQRHKIELMRMRGESHTPGVQNYGVGGDGLMDSGAIVNLLQNEYGNTRNYFK